MTFSFVFFYTNNNSTLFPPAGQTNRDASKLSNVLFHSQPSGNPPPILSDAPLNGFAPFNISKKMTSTPPTPTHPAHTLLTRAHEAPLATQIFINKIKNKPLLLTPTQTTSTSSHDNNRTLRRKIRARKAQYYTQHRHPRPLSAKEKRTLKLHDLRDEDVRYEVYKGLNRLWVGYIHEVLGFTRDGEVVSEAGSRVVTQESHGSLLASADFHGMEIEVVGCADPGRVGLKGIVVRETRGAVLVVTAKSEKRQILKRGTVFRVVVELPGAGAADVGDKRKLVFELHGSLLEVRPVERATKKFKWHAMDFL